MDRRDYLRLGGATLAAATAGCADAVSRLPAGENASTTTTPSPTADADDPATPALDGEFPAAQADAGTTLEDFESGPGDWTVRAGSASVVQGGPEGSDRCLRLAAAAGEQQARVRRTFDEPRNLADRAFSLAVRWTRSGSRFAVVQLSLWDADGDAVQYGQGTDTGQLAGWHRLDLGVAAVEGDPSLSAVTALDLSVWTGDGVAELAIDEVRTTPTPGDGAAVLCFDDVRESAASVAEPVLREHGFVGVGGVIAESVGTDRHLDLDRMAALADRGWEFCSHPQYDDRTLSSMPADDLRAVLARYREWLTEQGFEDGADAIIYPYGLIDDDGLDAVAEFHRLGLLAHGQPPYGPVLTAPLLGARVGGEETERAHAAIDHAATVGGVVPIMYHAIGTEDGIAEADFAATMQRIDDAGLSTITTREWLARMEGDG